MHRLSLNTDQETSQNDLKNTQVQSGIDSNPKSSDNLASSRRPTLEAEGSMKQTSLKLFTMIAVAAVFAGVGTGFGAYKLHAQNGSSSSAEPIQQVATGTVKKGDVFGSSDKETFKDSAEGYLEIGGINGEGSHRLLRPGGETQTVYLTSSVTDLDKLAGMDVQVWGETYKGQKAGWLMDVGRVEVLNPSGTAPTEE